MAESRGSILLAGTFVWAVIALLAAWATSYSLAVFINKDFSVLDITAAIVAARLIYVAVIWKD